MKNSILCQQISTILFYNKRALFSGIFNFY